MTGLSIPNWAFLLTDYRVGKELEGADKDTREGMVAGVLWSQRISELSLSNGMVIELRDRSQRQAFPFQVKARHFAYGASIGACRRPMQGLGPMSGFPHSCLLAVYAGVASSCCSLLDAAVTKRLL